MGKLCIDIRYYYKSHTTIWLHQRKCATTWGFRRWLSVHWRWWCL